MKKGKISIIIPVYNGEKYLERCVQSVLGQSYSNYEIIIVDDGSTDQTKQKGIKLSEKYDCVQFYQKQNGGVSSARNFGLDKMTGEFALFLDHDDYLDLDYLSCLFAFAEEKQLDIVRSGYKTVNEHNQIIQKYEYSEDCVIIPKDYFQIFLETTFFGYAGGIFIRKSAIQNKRFQCSLKFAEDLEFIRNCFRNSGKMGYLNHCGYNYFIHSESMTKNSNLKMRMKECQDNIQVFASFVDYGISGDLSLGSVYQRLNLKLKYLLKTNSISYHEFRQIIKRLYAIDIFVSLRKQYRPLYPLTDIPNRILMYLLSHQQFYLYYQIVNIYQTIRK